MLQTLQHRETCQECGYKNSLLITVTNGNKHWYCFNAGCKNRGSERTELDISQLNSLPKVRIVDTNNFISFRSNKDSFNYFNSYGLLQYMFNRDIHLWYDIKTKRNVFQYKELYIGRAIDKYVQPKWYIYTDTDYPFIVAKNKDTVVLVEDVVSALKVGQVTDSIALLGTNLKEKYIKYISKYKKVVVALDEDATTSALKIYDSLKLYTNCTILPLTKDLKYYTIAEITKKLEKHVKISDNTIDYSDNLYS